MRSRVEAGRLELVTSVYEERTHLSGKCEIRPRQLAVDIEHAKSDAFHVKGSNRAHKCLAFLDERTHCSRLGARLQMRNDRFNEGLRGLTVIGGHVACLSSVLSRVGDVNHTGATTGVHDEGS